MSTGLVEEFPAADPHIAAHHFFSRLSVETDPSDVYADLEAGVESFIIVDARSLSAYSKGHVKGAISLPHRSISPESTADLDRNKLIVVYCYGPGCNAGCKAGLKLAHLGFRVKEMIGGFEYWVNEGLPIEGTDAVDPDVYGKIS